MKVCAPISRSVGMALALPLLGSAAARGQAVIITETQTTTVKTDAKPNATLSPEVEKKLQAIMERARKQKRGAWDFQINKRIDDITKTTALNDNGVTALRKAAELAVSASTDEWAEKSMAFARKTFVSFPKDQLLVMLDQALASNGPLPMDDGPIAGQFVVPENQDVWTKALHQTLTAAQLDAWTQAQAKEKDAAEKEISTILKNSADRTRDMETSEIMAQCSSIEDELKLPKDRAAQLEALGKSAVDQTVEKYQKRVQDWLLSVDENQRRNMATNNWYMGVNSDESPTEQAVWKDGPWPISSLPTNRRACKATRTHARPGANTS